MASVTKNMVIGSRHSFVCPRRREEGRGINSAISRSKIRNKMATIKNRKENGRRDDVIGSNPHS